MIIQRIGVLKAGIVTGIFLATFNLLAAILVFVFGMVMGGGQAMGMMGGIGILSIIIAPIVGAIAGFIGGIIATALYNIALKLAGGLEIETR
jgi:hypothetical protein